MNYHDFEKYNGKTFKELGGVVIPYETTSYIVLNGIRVKVDWINYDDEMPEANVYLLTDDGSHCIGHFDGGINGHETMETTIFRADGNAYT